MSIGVSDVVGWVRLTSSGVVGDSGKAVDILGYTIKSGATAGVVTLMNGTVQTAPAAWADQARAVSTEQSVPLSFPIRLAAGCFVSFDSNVSAATVFYRQMLS